jgi:hypothetical protein
MTKLYFHNTTSPIANLPTTEQSALTADNNSDAQTVNRTMSPTIGSSQTSKVCATKASTSSQVVYFTKFVSNVLGVTSITSQTWNYAFAVAEDNVNANFPCSGDGKTVSVSVYVWNATNGTKVGDVLNGDSNADYNEPNSTATETTLFGTFHGAAVNSIPAGSVLVYEAIFQITQNNSTARSLTYYYDGNTETNTNGDTVSNHASYIETPQALTFAGGNVVKTLTSTVTISSTVARKATKARAIPTQTVSVVGPSTLAMLRNKKRAPPAETVTIATDAGSPSIIKAHNTAKAVPAETITVSSTVGFTRMRNRALAELVHVTDSVDYLQHPKKFKAPITQTVLLFQALGRTVGKKRSVLN